MNTTNAKKMEANGRNDIPFLAFANQAMKQYEQAMAAGLKMQGELAECWNRSFNQPEAVEDWQKRFTQFVSMANEAMPLAQEQMQDMISLMEKTSQAGTELMKKAFDAAQTPAIAESQSKWMDFWSLSLCAVRANTEAFTQLNTKAIDSCMDFVRKNTEVTRIRVPKAA